MAARSSAPGPMGGPAGVGRASGPPSWPATRATRIRVRGGCCAVVASGRSSPKSDQHCQPNFDRAAYRRPQPGRAQRRAAQAARRVATRYDKRARNYLAWVTLAAVVIWL